MMAAQDHQDTKEPLTYEAVRRFLTEHEQTLVDGLRQIGMNGDVVARSASYAEQATAALVQLESAECAMSEILGRVHAFTGWASAGAGVGSVSPSGAVVRNTDDSVSAADRLTIPTTFDRAIVAVKRTARSVSNGDVRKKRKLTLADKDAIRLELARAREQDEGELALARERIRARFSAKLARTLTDKVLGAMLASVRKEVSAFAWAVRVVMLVPEDVRSLLAEELERFTGGIAKQDEVLKLVVQGGPAADAERKDKPPVRAATPRPKKRRHPLAAKQRHALSPADMDVLRLRLLEAETRGAEEYSKAIRDNAALHNVTEMYIRQIMFRAHGDRAKEFAVRVIANASRQARRERLAQRLVDVYAHILKPMNLDAKKLLTAAEKLRATYSTAGT